MKLPPLAALLIALLLCGCQARYMNLSPPDLRLESHTERITNAEISKMFEDDYLPQMTNGNTVGIACVVADRPGFAGSPALVDLEIETWEDLLKDGTFIVDVIPVAAETLERMRTREVYPPRVNAARLQCEFLIVYGISSDYALQSNPLSILYLTIVGTMFVPGTQATVGTMVRAALIDVKDGHVYAMVDAAAEKSQVSSMLLVQTVLPQLYKMAATEALEKAQTKLVPILDRLRERATDREDLRSLTYDLR